GTRKGTAAAEAVRTKPVLVWNSTRRAAPSLVTAERTIRLPAVTVAPATGLGMRRGGATCTEIVAGVASAGFPPNGGARAPKVTELTWAGTVKLKPYGAAVLVTTVAPSTLKATEATPTSSLASALTATTSPSRNVAPAWGEVMVTDGGWSATTFTFTV